MKRSLQEKTAVPIAAVLVATIIVAARAQEGPRAQDDPFPRACVDCHVQTPDRDVRLSTLMRGWYEEVEPGLLEKARSVTPEGIALTGRHPASDYSLANIPSACVACHRRAESKAPPFAPMVHVIHLLDGDGNIFLAEFDGRCTHCHKLDEATGEMSVPSGPEE